MGWFFTKGASKQDIVQEILGDPNQGYNTQIVAHSLRGNHLWVVIKDKQCSLQYVSLFLLESQKDYGWGYKEIDETMGPAYYDCPITLIRKSGEPITEESRRWRQRVFAEHLKQRQRTKMFQKLKPGDWVWLYNNESAYEVSVVSPRKVRVFIEKANNHGAWVGKSWISHPAPPPPQEGGEMK